MALSTTHHHAPPHHPASPTSKIIIPQSSLANHLSLRLLPPEMRRLTPLLAPLLLTATAGGQDLVPRDGEESPRLPAVSLLPKGSTLEGVMLPQYDEQKRLLAVLRAGYMEIINEETVDADKVQIDMYRPDGGHRGSIKLAKARLDQAREMLHASGDARVVSEDMSARGTGLVLSLETSRGFLLGPVVTRFYSPPPETSMNLPHRPANPSASRLTAAVAAATWLPIAAAGPAPLTNEEIADLDRKAASAEPVAEQQAAEAAKITTETKQESAAADVALADLLHSAGLASLLAEGAPADPPADKPPEIPVKPGDTSIECDGGMYFDTKDGVIVYLDNIRLRDARFDLDCQKELKIFLEKKEEEKKDGPDGEKPDPKKEAEPGKADPEKNPRKTCPTKTRSSRKPATCSAAAASETSARSSPPAPSRRPARARAERMSPPPPKPPSSTPRPAT
jgi:hypothetical protein